MFCYPYTRIGTDSIVPKERALRVVTWSVCGGAGVLKKLELILVQNYMDHLQSMPPFLGFCPKFMFITSLFFLSMPFPFQLKSKHSPKVIDRDER